MLYRRVSPPKGVLSRINFFDSALQVRQFLARICLVYHVRAPELILR